MNKYVRQCAKLTTRRVQCKYYAQYGSEYCTRHNSYVVISKHTICRMPAPVCKWKSARGRCNFRARIGEYCIYHDINVTKKVFYTPYCIGFDVRERGGQPCKNIAKWDSAYCDDHRRSAI